MKMYTAQEMRVRADYLEVALADAKTAAMLRQAAGAMEREKDEALHSTALRTHETNFDRFAFIPEIEHGAQISTAFSFYLEEQYPPKLRGAVCMDRAYYDFMLWLFSAPGKNGETK